MSSAQTVTIIQTASTNRPETRIAVPHGAAHSTAAVISTGATASHEFTLSSHDRDQLWSALAAAGPLAGLPVSHCMKSASFGTSLFLEVDGQRSPDLSCQNQSDPKVAALRNQVEKIMQAAKATTGKAR